MRRLSSAIAGMDWWAVARSRFEAVEECRVEFIPHEMLHVWSEFHTTCCRPYIAHSIFSQPLWVSVDLRRKQ